MMKDSAFDLKQGIEASGVDFTQETQANVANLQSDGNFPEFVDANAQTVGRYYIAVKGRTETFAQDVNQMVC